MNGSLLKNLILGAVCVTCAPVSAGSLNCEVSWIANSYGGGRQWVQQDMEDIHVDPDGTLFSNIFWDEAGGNVQQYKEGELQRVAFHTHGWGYEGGDAVTANSRYVFIAQTVGNEGGGLKGNSWPAKGLAWSGVSRRLRSDLSKPAPFENGHGQEGDVLQGAFLPVNEFPDGTGHASIRGLAASETQLFVSSPFDNTIKVFDAETMRPVRSWNVAGPDKLCLDSAGRLWTLQKPAAANGKWAVACFSTDGQSLPPKLELDALPTDLCVDGTNRLLIADAGPDQQIKIFSITSKPPRLTATLGTKGGIFAGPVAGQFGDARFNRPKGVGIDGQGNIYVASSGSVAGGSTVLECYAPNQTLKWRRMGLTFCDLACVDPNSETDIFTKEERFTMDYAKPVGQQWAYKSYTVNPWKYPDDPRIHLSPTHVWVKYLGGKRFLFVTDMSGEHLYVYRFNPATDGETAIPCASISPRHIKQDYPPHQPERGEWLWLDRNANGTIDPGEYQVSDHDSQGPFVPDDSGTLWQINGNTIRSIPFDGLAGEIPQWNFAHAKTESKPETLDQLRRLLYQPSADVMFIGGNKGDDHNQHWKPMGPVLCCCDHWKTSGRSLRWSVVLPYEKGSAGHESAEPISFDVAGDYIFVGYTRGLKEEGTHFAFVKVLSAKDGSIIGNLVPETVVGEIGLLDLAESVKASKRQNGEYVVFLEDDYKSKVVMLRWRPSM